MTLPELTNIIRTADEKAIKSELKRLSYIDCAKHKEYKHISLTDLFNGDLQETDDYPDSRGKRTYQGGIFTTVKGYEQLEFIIVNINDKKHNFPIKLLIWAKNKNYLELEIASEHCQWENCNGCPLYGNDECFLMVEDYKRKLAESED